MDSKSFPIYLGQGVKSFALRFTNPYHFKLFKQQIASMGFTVKEVSPSQEVDARNQPKWSAAEVMIEQASRAALFQKVFYICPFESTAWAKLKKAKLSSPCVMYTDNAKATSAEVWEGPDEAQILGEMQQRLASLGFRFQADAWTRVIAAFRTKDKEAKITDPMALWNALYSIALQSEGMVDMGQAMAYLGQSAQIYDLLECLIAKNLRGSLQAMYLLVQEEDVIGLCAGLEKMLCDQLDVYAAFEKGETPDAYAIRVGWHPYRAKMAFQKLMPVPKVNLIRLTEALLKADMLMKSNRSISKAETFKHEMMAYLDL